MEKTQTNFIAETKKENESDSQFTVCTMVENLNQEDCVPAGH